MPSPAPEEAAAPLCSLQTLPGPMTPLPVVQPAPPAPDTVLPRPVAVAPPLLIAPEGTDTEAAYHHLMQQILLPRLHSMIPVARPEELLAFDQLLRDEGVKSPPHTSLTHPEEFEL